MRIRELALKTPKFIISNVLGTVVDTAVLWLFSEYVFMSYAGKYVLSPVISFECAVFTNFVCSWFFVWKDRVDMGSGKAFMRKYLFYNISASAVFLVKMGFLLLFEALFGWPAVYCNLAALCISGVLNFSLGEWVIFRKRAARGQ
ncbi:MAG: GtrA family protein [Bacteroidales bacterium]|nr:GtrA family protein [Bacteroidales bacterium]